SESETVARRPSRATTSAMSSLVISPFQPNHRPLCSRTTSASATATPPAWGAFRKSRTRLGTQKTRRMPGLHPPVGATDDTAGVFRLKPLNGVKVPPGPRRGRWAALSHRRGGRPARLARLLLGQDGRDEPVNLGPRRRLGAPPAPQQAPPPPGAPPAAAPGRARRCRRRGAR